MADLNAQLEAFLSNALAERSVQSREVRKHMPGLKQLLLRIRQAIADSGVMEPSPGREPRVRLLVSTIAEVIQREWGAPTLAAMQSDLVPYFAKQLAFGRRMIETAGGTLANAGAVVAAPARVAAAVDGAVVQGKLFGQTITRSIPGLIADRVERYIRLGLGDVASGDVLYRDAVVSYAQRTVEATIRTAVHETGNAAQQLIYQVEADPAWLGEDGLVWTSSLDSTVCPTCIALNGRRYPTGSVKVSPHPNCNCYLLPWKYEKKDSAKRKTEGDKGVEYIPVKRTTESFLRDNPDTTRQIFGKARGEALLRDLRSNDEKTRRNALNRAVKSWQAT